VADWLLFTTNATISSDATDRQKAWQVGWFWWKASGGFPYIGNFFLEEAFIIAKCHTCGCWLIIAGEEAHVWLLAAEDFEEAHVWLLVARRGTYNCEEAHVWPFAKFGAI